MVKFGNARFELVRVSFDIKNIQVKTFIQDQAFA